MNTKKRPPKIGIRQLSKGLPEVDSDQETKLLSQPVSGELNNLRTEPRKNKNKKKWEDSNIRVTFYCPEFVLLALEKEVSRGDSSKSALIVEALFEKLALDREKR